MRSRFLLVLPLLFLCGCGASVVNFVPNGSANYEPRLSPEEIVVFTEEPEREYEVIGRIYAEKEAATAIRWDNVDAEDVVKLLKQGAAKHGADAIIFDGGLETIGERARDWKKGSAKAIRFR